MDNVQNCDSYYTIIIKLYILYYTILLKLTYDSDVA
jgi:hypothetical protein